jgi:hypothetical protein
MRIEFSKNGTPKESFYTRVLDDIATARRLIGSLTVASSVQDLVTVISVLDQASRNLNDAYETAQSETPEMVAIFERNRKLFP